MTSLLKSTVMTKRLMGGRTLNFTRNAGGHGGAPAPPGSGPLPFPPGPKQMQQLKNWTASTFIYGATAFTALCYFSDWKVVTEWIPFYRGKYKEE